MFVTDPIRCAENIADSLKSHNVSANQINLVAQDDVNLILFCFHSAENDATIIGSYFLRLRDRKRSRATTVRDTVMSGDAKSSSSSVVLLCQLPGKMDIVHMSVDSRLLQLLSIVYCREINGKTIYFVDLIDVRKLLTSIFKCRGQAHLYDYLLTTGKSYLKSKKSSISYMLFHDYFVFQEYGEGF